MVSQNNYLSKREVYQFHKVLSVTTRAMSQNNYLSKREVYNKQYLDLIPADKRLKITTSQRERFISETILENNLPLPTRLKITTSQRERFMRKTS